jgi:hypothetical protein
MAREGYGGLIGAFPYAFRQSSSRSFRVYVLVAAMVAGLVTLIVASGVIGLLADTGRTEGTAGFVRGFYILVGVAALAPLLAPVLLVARRHRRADGATPGYERVMAAAGFTFIVLLYTGLVASTPVERQQTLKPLVIAAAGHEIEIGVTVRVARFLYDLPRIAGLIFPLVGTLIVVFVHRRTS